MAFDRGRPLKLRQRHVVDRCAWPLPFALETSERTSGDQGQYDKPNSGKDDRGENSEQ